MDVILYNPKRFNGKAGVPVPNVFNLDGSQKEIILPLGNFEPLAVNELKKYPEDVADAIVERWGFIQKVKPEEIEVVQKLMTDKAFRCDQPGCDYESDSEQALRLHKVKKHKLSNEVEEKLKQIPSAKTFGSGRVSAINTDNYSPEGIPNGESDGWYGAGEETISHTKVVRPGMAGVFGG